jgi:hypothetical protein
VCDQSEDAEGCSVDCSYVLGCDAAPSSAQEVGFRASRLTEDELTVVENDFHADVACNWFEDWEIQAAIHDGVAPHGDGQQNGKSADNLTFLRNVWINQWGRPYQNSVGTTYGGLTANTAFMMSGRGASGINDVIIEENVFCSGGRYTVYVVAGGGPVRNLRIMNNDFTSTGVSSKYGNRCAKTGKNPMSIKDIGGGFVNKLVCGNIYSEDGNSLGAPCP